MNWALSAASAAMRKVLEVAATLALSDDPILILGERGTGKSCLATHIHTLSKRTGTFVAHHLSGHNEDLHLATLFGHTRGAFTGAARSRLGLVEAARHGTLFLDELGNAALDLQASLLSLFEPWGVRRLGEDRPRPVMARIIAATNANIDARVATGAFRDDLLDRFGCFRLVLPPLRDRRDEIVPLFKSFLETESLVLKRTAPERMTPAVHSMLLNYEWPGNIRELRSVAHRAILFHDGTAVLAEESLPDTVRNAAAPISSALPQEELRARILRALEATRGNRSAAARLLGVSRRQFYRLIKQAGIE